MRALVTVGQGLGNMVMTTPLMAALAALGYRVDALVQSMCPGAETLLHGWEVVADVYVTPPSRSYDAVCRTAWHRGAPLGLGSEHGLGDGDLRRTHEAVANLAPARALGYARELPPAHVECDAPPLTLIERYAVFAPGYGGDETFWRRKQWPWWPALAARLLRECDLDLVVLGAARDAADWPNMTWGPVLNLCGRTTLRQAAGVLAGAAFVVALDNGLAHVAAALGVPVYVLFGATSEIKNRPLGVDVTVLDVALPCRPCQMTTSWHACRNWRCMEQLDPDDVWRRIDERNPASCA